MGPTKHRNTPKYTGIHQNMPEYTYIVHVYLIINVIMSYVMLDTAEFGVEYLLITILQESRCL